MPYMMSQAVRAVRTLLRRPSDLKLPYLDIQERLNALLKGYVQDMDLSGRDHRTMTDAVEVSADDIDYTVSMQNVPDFEAVRLEYSPRDASGDVWYKATLIPFAAWAENYSTDRVVASIYGSSALVEGQKLKLNISPDNYRFRLSYRLPLLAVVQMGERPPIPENFMPMLEFDGAIDCKTILNDNTAETSEWWKGVQPIYTARAEQWRERWQKYLETTVEDPIQPLARSDQHRHTGGRRTPRAYLPRG